MLPIHPIEILREKYGLLLGFRTNSLSIEPPVTVTRSFKILNEGQAVSPRLACRFYGDAQTRLNLRAALNQEGPTSEHGEHIDKSV